MSLEEKKFYDDCHNPAYKSILENIIEEYLQSERGQGVLLKSFTMMIGGTKLLNRMGLLEEFTGLNVDRHCIGDDWDWDEMTPHEQQMHPEIKKIVVQPLKVQLDQMNDRIDDSSIPTLRETVFAGNETEIRARLLLNKLPDFPVKNGIHQMNTKEVGHFLLNEVTEEHRTTKISARKIAGDVMKRAVELFPDDLKLIKNMKKELVIQLVPKR